MSEQNPFLDSEKNIYRGRNRVGVDETFREEGGTAVTWQKPPRRKRVTFWNTWPKQMGQRGEEFTQGE